MKRRSYSLAVLVIVGLFWAAGCGGPAPQETSNSPAPKAGATAPRPAPASVGDAASVTAEAGSIRHEPAGPDKGSPEWLIAEMSRLRSAPLLDETPQETGGETAVDVERIRAASRERNLQIARLAEEAIAETHSDPQQELLFNAAVHHLIESRLQLALQGGEQAHIDALYETADVLKQRDPKSKAAADAGFALVQYAAANARKFASQEPKWLEHFARQARLFAADFPHDEARAIAVLDAAGWSCEVHGLRSEALACYTQIQQQYSQHPDAAHIPAILRRLNLQGQPLQLLGTTFDGGELRIEDLRGKIVLVVFWAAGQNGFDEQLPALQAAAERHSQKLVLVGVNLDTDEAAVGAFLEQHAVTWPTIFFVDPARRGWANPIASYYGLRNVPAYWLVDPQGNVVSTEVDPAKLDQILTPLMAAGDAPTQTE